MKKLTNSCILIIILFFFITAISCSSYEPIQIQVLKPALYTVPGDIGSIVLINHANYKKSTFTVADSNSKREASDSIQTNEYFRGLLNILLNSPRFTVVNDTPIYIVKPGYNERYEDLDWQTVQSICKEKNADAAIVLENYMLSVPENISVSYTDDFSYLKGTLQITNNSIWQIYVVSQNKIADDYLLKDTLFWDAYGENNYQLISQLPDINTAVLQSCYYAGSKYGERIAQTWTTKTRYIIYAENKDFREAYNLAKQDKWDEAIELWKKYPYGKNKRLAAFAAYNLAVASETLDHIDIALEWASKSYLLKKEVFVQRYINTLEKRKKEQAAIEDQFK